MIRAMFLGLMLACFVLPGQGFAPGHAKSPSVLDAVERELGLTLDPVAHNMLHTYEAHAAEIMRLTIGYMANDEEAYHLVAFARDQKWAVGGVFLLGAFRFENHPQHRAAHNRSAAIRELYDRLDVAGRIPTAMREDVEWALQFEALCAIIDPVNTADTIGIEWSQTGDFLNEVATEHPVWVKRSLWLLFAGLLAAMAIAVWRTLGRSARMRNAVA